MIYESTVLVFYLFVRVFSATILSYLLVLFVIASSQITIKYQPYNTFPYRLIAIVKYYIDHCCLTVLLICFPTIALGQLTDLDLLCL